MLLKSNVERYSLFAQPDTNMQHFTAQSLSQPVRLPAPLTQGSLGRFRATATNDVPQKRHRAGSGKSVYTPSLCELG